MVTSVKKEPTTPGGILAKNLFDQIQVAIKDAHSQAFAKGLSVEEYTAAVGTALEIQLCHALVSQSLVPLGDVALARSLVSRRLQLADITVGESIRKSTARFMELCHVMNEKHLENKG